MTRLKLSEILNFPDLDKHLLRFNKYMKDYIKSDSSLINKEIKKIIDAPRKSLRPALLLFIVANNKKTITEDVIRCCVALELVHIASLIHDDIIDNAEDRWGIETTNKKLGANQAILVGDFLFAKANETAAKVSSDVAEVIARTISLLCEGEISELKDAYNLNRKISDLMKSTEGKTASLLSASCEVAAIINKSSEFDKKSLSNYGFYFGISFQFIDDILDFISNSKISGKSVGKDIEDGIYTMPVLLSLKSKYRLKTQTILNSKKINLDELIKVLLNSDSINKSIYLAKEYMEIANKTLIGLKNTKVSNGLNNLSVEYINWSLNNLIDSKYKKELNKITSNI